MGKALFTDPVWRKVTTFAAIMIVVNATFNVLIIRNGGDIQQNIGYGVVLIFSPAIVGMLVTLVFDRSLRGFGWKWKSWRITTLSYVVPLVYIAVAYGAVIGLGFADIVMNNVRELGVWGIVLIPTLGITGVLLQVIGEEIGWRGFLFSNLAQKMSFTKASLIVGAAWAVFHYPLIIFGTFAGGKTPVLFAITCFTVAIMGANMAINWMYAQSASLWPAVVFHATHNSVLNDIHKPDQQLVADTTTASYLLTEFGAALAVVLAVTGFLFWLRRPTTTQVR